MSPNPLAIGRVRSSAAVNEAIRALLLRSWGRPFTDDERVAYGLLLEEWAAAVQAEMVEAA